MHDVQHGWPDRRWRAFFGVTVAAVTAIVIVFPVSVRGGQPERTATPDGAALFNTYCASCHDTTGRGHGPMARALRQAPADLTQISKRNGGMFPTARMGRIIEGRDVESHGDRDMPVWGDAFKTTPEGRSQGSAEARIDAIVRYLESIQQREAQ